MKVYALVGKSGTGKSYKAISVAHEHAIDLIIDDGLLINGSKLLGGKSAKREATTIGAVKRAIFHHDDHKSEIITVLDNDQYESILILATSERMAVKIANNLSLGGIDEYIYITDISTPRDLELASHNRNKKGKHIIPLPTLELRKHFSGYLLDKVKHILWPNESGREIISEKTVTRPTFSYYGKFTISDNTIQEIVKIATRENELIDLLKVKVINKDENILITTYISTKYGTDLQKEILKFQRLIIENVYQMTLLNIISCDVIIKDIKI